MDKLKKLATLKENPSLAIFDSIEELNDNVKALIQAVESSKTEPISLDPISTSIDSLAEAIQAIPKPKETDMSKVENLLTVISKKEVKETDNSELTATLNRLGDSMKALRESVQEPLNITVKIV
jgi:hypothetical protein